MRHSSPQRKFGRFTGISSGLAALAISAMANQAYAQAAEQEAEKPAQSSEEVESITVVGTRASLKSSIERKRAAGTVSDSIVAEDIAQFPDKNIGEALSAKVRRSPSAAWSRR
jgi:iron complex outermembrane receptor protein